MNYAFKPADEEHQFGHGKIENLSTLVETILLLLTVVWVIYEAARRIILSDVNVNTSPITFGIILFAIVIDYSRSRALYRGAEKYDSQALKADALHFSTDILSSSVVFVGLVFTHLGFPLGDPLGAIGVAIIVLILTIKLGRETIDSLLDRVPSGFHVDICAVVEQVEGLLSCGRVRIRKAGSLTFIDIEINADPPLSLDMAHQIGDHVKFAIENVVGLADIMIHMHPLSETFTLWIEDIRQESKQFDWIKGIHKIYAIESHELVHVSLHIEVNPQESLVRIHQLVTSFEDHLKQIFPNIEEVITHIEPYPDQNDYKMDHEALKQKVKLLTRRTGILKNIHDIKLFPAISGVYHMTFRCEADQDCTIKEIHRATTTLEGEIREELSIFSQIVIHVEPLLETDSKRSKT